MQIVDFFYMIARENLRIKSFAYGKQTAKGAGSDMYPLIWLDDPITGGTQVAGNLGTLQYTVNVDILGVPIDDEDVINVQDAAFLTGLGIPERAKVIYKTARLTFMGFQFITVRDYYDDAAAGVRFTYNLSLASPVDRCANDYDPDKVLDNANVLPQFSVDAPDGCAVFSDHVGLPNFSVAPDVVSPPLRAEQVKYINNMPEGNLRYQIAKYHIDDPENISDIVYDGEIAPGASYTTQLQEADTQDYMILVDIDQVGVCQILINDVYSGYLAPGGSLLLILTSELHTENPGGGVALYSFEPK